MIPTGDEIFYIIMKPHSLTTAERLMFSLCFTVLTSCYSSRALAEDTLVVTTDYALAAPADTQFLLPADISGFQAEGSQQGILGNVTRLNSPFNITAYTADYLRLLQARSIADVVLTDASIINLAPPSGYRDAFSIRGFNLLSYNVAYDGLYGIAPKQRFPAEFAERIEVLEGPNTFINGINLGGSPGGAINIIPKRATAEPVTSLTTTYQSKGNVGTAADIGRRFGDEQQFGIRFNGLLDGGQLSRLGQSRQLMAGTLSMDYLGDTTRLSANFGLQQDKTTAADWPILLGKNITRLPPPPATANLSQTWSRIATRDRYFLVKAEHDLTDNWTLFTAFGVSATQTTGLYIQPTLLDNQGEYLASIYSFPSAGRHYSAQVGVRGKVMIGDVDHHLTLAVTRWQQSLKATRFSGGSYIGNSCCQRSHDRPYTSSWQNLNRLYKTSTYDFTSLVAADTLGIIDDKLLLTLGGRLQEIRNSNYDAFSGDEKSSYQRERLSPAFGAVYHLSADLSIYGNYTEALLQPSSIPINAKNYGDTLKPIISKQQEIGIKGENSLGFISVSLFRITQPSAYLDSATDVYGIYGKQRNQGLEVNSSGKVTDNLKLLGGISWIEGKQIKTQNAKNEGNRSIGIPTYQGNVGFDYELPFARNIAINGHFLFNGNQYANNENTQKIAHWNRTDIGASYSIHPQGMKAIILRASVKNVFNSNYWQSAASGQIAGISRSEPRTYVISCTFNF